MLSELSRTTRNHCCAMSYLLAFPIVLPLGKTGIVDLTKLGVEPSPICIQRRSKGYLRCPTRCVVDRRKRIVASNYSFDGGRHCLRTKATQFAVENVRLGTCAKFLDSRQAICLQSSEEEANELCGAATKLQYGMADISKSNPGIGKKGLELDKGTGGGVAVITRPRVDKKTAKKSKTEREPSWRVLLHNDDVHTFDYVTGAIVKVVRTVSRKKAHRITMQAHSSGVATVTTTWKALAEDYCKGLQMHGLTSSIAPDSSFKA